MGVELAIGLSNGQEVEVFSSASGSSTILATSLGGAAYRPLNIDSSALGLNTAAGTGNVIIGVGTPSPVSKLTISDGDIRISTTTGSRGIIFQDGSSQTTSAQPAVFSSTYAIITADTALGTDPWVCIATATWTANGGRAVFYFTGSANAGGGTDCPKVGVLLNGAVPSPYSTAYGAISYHCQSNKTPLNFSIPAHSNLSAGSNSICLAAWRTTAVSGNLICTTDAPCILHVLETK